MTGDRGGRSTTADRVYGELRQRILDGRLRLNQHLVETDLAIELGASRTPIRQGLQRLELEGLVHASRSGWVVREHSIADVVHVYDVRLPLEGFAARLAAERGTDEHLARLRELELELARHHGPDDREAYVRLHDELHDVILQAAANDVLRDAVRRYRDHAYNRRVAHLYTDRELELAERSHAELVTAIRARDADAAERSGRQHLELSREVTLERLRRLG